MKKKTGVIASFILLAVCFLSVAASFVMAKIVTATVVRTEKTTSATALFRYDKNVQSQSDYHIPDGTGFIADGRGGLKVSASAQGGFETASAMVGDFELDFKVFSSSTGVNDFDLLTFTFTDEANGESFKVYYDMVRDASFEQKGIGKAFVTFPNGYTKYGAYEGDKLLNYQWGGVYVASFNNLKSDGRENNAAAQKIKFLPVEKQVYIGDLAGNYQLLVDLDDPKSCERANSAAVTGFEKYRVRAEFSSLREHVDETNRASMVVYSLNGQSLAGTKLKNTAAPSVSVRFDVQAVEGYKYLLPTPVQYDVIDGFTAYNGEMRVCSDGADVPVENGYIKEPRFGKYKLTLYGMTDSDGLVAEEKTFEFSVRLNHPGHDIFVSEELPDYTVGTGSGIYLPAFTSESKIGLYGDSFVNRHIAVEKDGAVVYETDNADSAGFYRAATSGIYTVRLISEDAIGNIAEKKFVVTVEDAAPVFGVGAFNGIYKLGAAFVAPETKVTVNGVAVNPVCRLYSPFGIETTATDTAGDYIYKVSYAVDGKEYFVQRGFRVLRGAEQLFENLRGSTLEANAVSSDFAVSYSGVKVSANRSNSTVKYIHPVDITKLTGNVPLLEFLPLPREKGIADFGMITITLTDVNNPSSSIGVKISRSYDRGYYWLSLVRAGVNNDNYAGWAWGQLKTDEGSGTNMTVSFLGETYRSDMKATSGKIYFDYATKTFYCSYFEDKLPILDLDSTADVGLGNEWMGFSSDYAYLTVTANSLENRTGDYMIVSVAGQPLGETYPESVSPVEISVDMLGNEVPPVGKVNIPYPVFNATAADNVNKNIPYSVNVYFNYGSSSQKAIPLRNDGAFVPTTEGVYTIVYSSGNVKKRVKVTVGKTDDLAFVTSGDYPETVYAGQETRVPEVKVTGGSGNKTITYTAKYADGENIPITAGSFKPTRASVVTITVCAVDYLGEAAYKKYNINVEYGKKPVVDFLPSVSTAYIAGKTYGLPQITGVDYADGAKPAESETFVRTSGGLTSLPGGKWKPASALVGASGVQIVYRLYKGGDKSIFEEFAYDVSVVKPAAKKDYFTESAGTEKVDSKDGMHFTVAKENGGVRFINPVVTELDLTFAAKTAAVGGLVIGLTDSVNADIRVEMVLRQDGARCFMYLNGARSGGMAGTFGGDSFGIKLIGNAVYNGKNNICGTLTHLVNGKAFTGFHSGMVYIDMQFVGVSGKTTAAIMGINGQLFDDTSKDYMRPQIFLEKEIVRNASINETVIIPAARAYDVLDPYTEIMVTVKGPKGWVIFNKQPVDRELSFKAERYGQYTITYTAIDSNKNIARYPASVTVMDDIPPELDVKGEMPKVARVGDKVVLPEIKATDNTDGDVKVYAHYIDPKGRMIRIENGAFVPKITGEYKILIFAKDEAYSFVRKEYTLRVGR